MKTCWLLILVIIPFFAFTQSTFKSEQLKYSRVRQAYKEKEATVLHVLDQKQIAVENLQIYLRAFKSEKLLELWGKNEKDSKFKLIKTYKICRLSGSLGPKRKQGDLQIPEGYYHINRFNPFSNFYLSLGLNYPNKSDKILGIKHKLGGDIFIHGACVTIGCLPITDNEIKELYVYCIEARNNGQQKIPVTVFPAKLNDEKFAQLCKSYINSSDKVNLWTDLRKGYVYFNESKQLPSISFITNGRHDVSP